jgi:hypothetical protein
MLAALALPLMVAGPAMARPATQQSSPTLVAAARTAIAPFQDVAAAKAAGYAPMFGCVSGPEGGGMGIHLMNGNLVGDGELAEDKPEALLYEMRDGQMHLLGVEYLVMADAWDASHDGPPTLMGQLFNYVGSPNRYGNPPFYELHVWAEKDNPNGTFADWNPTVTCDDYVPAR